MVGFKSLCATAVLALQVVFANAQGIPNNLDVNGDGGVDILDVVDLVNYIVTKEGFPISAPTPAPVAIPNSECYQIGFNDAVNSKACNAPPYDHGAVNCKYSRTILQLGSSTVFPIAEGHANRYPHAMVMPFAKSSGSTLGFQNFLAGGSDISTASRALAQKDYDSADCEDPSGTNPGVVDGVAQYECQGRFPFGVLVGRDMLAVIVNSKLVDQFPNDIISLTNSQLKTLIETSSYKGTQVNLYVPDAFSGTRDFFEDALEVDLSGVLGFVDDNEITMGVSNDDVGVGVAPLAFVEGSAGFQSGAFQVMTIDSVNPVTTNSPESYFFTRPLYKYFDKANPNEEAVDYICALLDTPDIVESVGYVPLGEDELKAIISAPELLCEDRVNPTEVNFINVFLEMSFCQDANILSIIGSSTVYPVSLAGARIFPSTMSVFVPASTGSSIGLRDVIASATDIGAASRALKQSDYTGFDCTGIVTDGQTNEPCQGVLPLGIQIGTDNLAVIINKGHAAVNGANFFFTMQNLLDLFVNELSWPQVVPGSQCGAAILFVPDVNSGTHDFMEEALEDSGVCSGAACDITAPGFVNDGSIITGVAENVCGIGFLGQAFVEDPDTVASIQGTDGSVVNPFGPGETSNYQLARPLYYYFDNTPDAYDAIINEYICFVLSGPGREMVQLVGYTVTADDVLPPANILFCGFPSIDGEQP